MTKGKDPLFAAYDGSDCPSLPQAERASHGLLLDYGLIRIERPWPIRGADFEITVVRDPNGCNSGRFGPDAGKVSVYRRPRLVANMKYLLAMGFAYDPKQGMPLPLDPETGKPVSGNLMADGRTLTLKAQMLEPALTHLRMTKGLSPTQIARITDFEMRIYAAQSKSPFGTLDADRARGGPQTLADSAPGQLGSIASQLGTSAGAVWSEFAAWEKDNPALPADERAFRLSVARGAKIFRDKMFLISDSAGINSPVGFGNPVRNSCVFCHNMAQMGNDVAPGQVDLGTTTLAFAVALSTE